VTSCPDPWLIFKDTILKSKSQGVFLYLLLQQKTYNKPIEASKGYDCLRS